MTIFGEKPEDTPLGLLRKRQEELVRYAEKCQKYGDPHFADGAWKVANRFEIAIGILSEAVNFGQAMLTPITEIRDTLRGGICKESPEDIELECIKLALETALNEECRVCLRPRNEHTRSEVCEPREWQTVMDENGGMNGQ